jgi:diketogulonate reductase-like aldo/keto reductase
LVLTVPTIILNNGITIPTLGFGVFQTPPDETAAAVEEALRVGYRHIDTAAGYANERGVGEGIKRSGLAREDVFIETKIWLTDYGYDETQHGFEKSARKLGVEQVDLLLLHHTWGVNFERTLAAYRGLEKLLADGRVRAIGVSNFMPRHLEKLLAVANVVPAVDQVELHPYFQQPDVQRANRRHGILTQAWAPLGGITFYRSGFAKSTLEEHAKTQTRTGTRGLGAVAGCDGLRQGAGDSRPARDDCAAAHGGGSRHGLLRHSGSLWAVDQ